MNERGMYYWYHWIFFSYLDITTLLLPLPRIVWNALCHPYITYACSKFRTVIIALSLCCCLKCFVTGIILKFCREKDFLFCKCTHFFLSSVIKSFLTRSGNPALLKVLWLPLSQSVLNDDGMWSPKHLPINFHFHYIWNNAKIWNKNTFYKF